MGGLFFLLLHLFLYKQGEQELTKLFRKHKDDIKNGCRVLTNEPADN